MNEAIIIKRTTTTNPDFNLLVKHLDNELWNELNEDQGLYDQYNKVPGIKTAVIVYVDGKPAAIGCFKEVANDTVEIKRMFTEKTFRGKGLSRIVLRELEKWAIEEGFAVAVLETSIHFTIARKLYDTAGYSIIPNYGQYIGLEESICMKKMLKQNEPVIDHDIIYFKFEEDFIEDGLRCIPMIVRFKLDKAGIKLKLSEWAKFSQQHKTILAKENCDKVDEIKNYRLFVSELVKYYTKDVATFLTVENSPAWDDLKSIPTVVLTKATEFRQPLTLQQWSTLDTLQRFALFKLCRSNHENKNFPKAVKEFNLTASN